LKCCIVDRQYASPDPTYYFDADPDLERVYPTQSVTHSVAVADPDLDSPDPHVFRPYGSGSVSISQRY
jgi:hypothetical protein